MTIAPPAAAIMPETEVQAPESLAEHISVPETEPLKGHVILTVGAAVSGAQAAWRLAEAGAYVVVIEQNDLPFGKVYSGLPPWHDVQKEQEYDAIYRQLSHPRILFVPQTAIGKEGGVPWERLRAMGASATILATGAERDRQSDIPGAEVLVDQGVAYQNPWIAEFNRLAREGDWRDFPVGNSLVIQGGGLASIDVAKVWMFVRVGQWLRGKGINVTLHDLNRDVDTVLKQHGFTFEDTGIVPPVLYYRRANEEMPIGKPNSRLALVKVAGKKYHIQFEFNTLITNISSNGRKIQEVVIQDTENNNGDVVPVANTERVVPTDSVVFSMGSIPAIIDGLPVRNSLYHYGDRDRGEFAGLAGVFGVGNMVTGKGNIDLSRASSDAIVTTSVAQYLGLTGEDFAKADVSVPEPDAEFSPDEIRGALLAAQVEQYAAGKPHTSPEAVKSILDFVQERWNAVGYRGLRDWLTGHGYAPKASGETPTQQ